MHLPHDLSRPAGCFDRGTLFGRGMRCVVIPKRSTRMMSVTMMSGRCTISATSLFSNTCCCRIQYDETRNSSMR